MKLTHKEVNDLLKIDESKIEVEGLIDWRITPKFTGFHSVLCVCNEGKICPEHNGLKVSAIPYCNCDDLLDEEDCLIHNSSLET